MSDSNDQANDRGGQRSRQQSGQRGGQPRGQGGHGGQQGGQGGQPADQQGRRGAQQGQQGRQQSTRQQQRRPPGGGGGRGPSSSGPFDSPVSKQYLLGVVGTLFALALAVGLVVMLLGAMSGPALTEDVDEDLSDQEMQDRQDRQEANFKATNVQIGIFIVPFVAFAAVGVFGLLAGANLPGSVQEKLIVAVVGAVVGTILFVTVSDFLLSTQYPAATDENFVSEQSLETANVLTTAISTAIASAVLTGIGVVLGDRFDAVGGSL